MKTVIDANVVIHGRRGQEFSPSVTVPEVMEEMRSSNAQKRLENSGIEVLEPDEESLEKVRKVSEEINSPTSKADEKVVALADSISGKIVSDDKAVQNLASKMDIQFEGYMEDRIDSEREWKLICSRCGSECSRTPCPRCGCENLDRKPC